MSKLKERAEAAGRKLDEQKGVTAPVAPNKRPISSPGAVMVMQPVIDGLEEKVAALEGQLKSQHPDELPYEMLVKVPGRQRRLSPEEYDELKRNLSVNKMLHRVIVRPSKHGDGKYEIVSGGNRSDVCRDLGRPVPVDVRELEDGEVERIAFYANLIHAQMPDFEKYENFKKMRAETGWTDAQLAQNSGVPESTLSRLFAFDSLPEQAIEEIRKHPRCIGSTAAAELAGLIKSGKGQGVAGAVSRLAAGAITQKDAVRIAQRANLIPVQPTAKTAPEPVTVKARGGQFCRIVGNGSGIRLSFKDEKTRLAAQEKIHAVLEDLANSSG